jgi:hypothetical protein
MWFKIIPTKIEKYASEKDISLFLSSFFQKFPHFSRKHGISRAFCLKKVCFMSKNWKIEKSRGLFTFAKSRSGPHL